MIGETNCRLFFDLNTYAVALTNAHEHTMGKINVKKNPKSSHSKFINPYSASLSSLLVRRLVYRVNVRFLVLESKLTEQGGE